MKVKVKNWHWEDDDIIAELENGEIYKLIKPYPSGISFGELDYNSSENVMIELNVRYDMPK